MSFNPLMGLLTQSVLPLCGGSRSVMELGNQTLTVNPRAFRVILERAVRLGQDQAGLAAIAALDGSARDAATEAFYRAIGAGSYAAIDVNDRYGSLIMDLNAELASTYDYRETFDLVTNNGTGEHVFNQYAVIANVHALTAVDGLMVHVMPFINYINHGFYSFQPNLYHALSEANGYELLCLGAATREGVGVVAYPAGRAAGPAGFLVDETEVSLGELLTEPKLPRRNQLSGRVDALRIRLPGAPPKHRFGAQLHRLLLKGKKLLGVAVLRKRVDAPFVTPMQLRYVDDVDASLAGSASE
ncbi:MAG: hypothetical protein R3E84_19250 [Pseudomonadales bacterium]